MKSKIFSINNIPAILYGEDSDSGYIFVHGQGGNKFEAERFARLATLKGYQVLSIDLPQHGERKDNVNFVAWEVVEELKNVMRFAKQKWSKISIRATSIGVYFSLLALKGEKIEKCLFVSPLVDMNRMILDLMKLSNVSKEELEIKKEIKTDFGQTLSWQYYCYAQENQVKAICDNTEILYAKNDEIIPFDTVEKFAKNNGCRLTILNGGEHWIHLKDDVEKMEKWEKDNLVF